MKLKATKGGYVIHSNNQFAVLDGGYVYWSAFDHATVFDTKKQAKLHVFNIDKEQIFGVYIVKDTGK